MLKLTPEQEKTVCTVFGGIIGQRELDMKDLVDNKLPEYWKRHAGNHSSKKDKSFPWPGSADFHVPFTAWADAHTQARLEDGIVNSYETPKVTAAPGAPFEAIEAARKATNYFRFLKATYPWYVEYLKKFVQLPMVEGTAYTLLNMESKGGARVRYKEVAPDVYALDEGQNIEVEEVPQAPPMGELNAQKLSKAYYYGPVPTIVSRGNFLYPKGYDNVQDCPWVAVKFTMPFHKLLEMKDAGWKNIDQLVSKKPIKLTVTGGKENTTVTTVQEVLAKSTGDNNTAAGSPVDVYTLYNVYAYYQFEGDKVCRRYQFVLDLGQNLVLFADENKDFWNEVPIDPVAFHKLSGIMDGQGQPERLALCNDLMDTCTNQTIDNGTVSNCNIVTIMDSKCLTPLEGATLRPGFNIFKVSAPDAVKVMDISKVVLDHRYTYGNAVNMAERMAVTSDTSQGQMPNVERPTARGMMISLDQLYVNFGLVMGNYIEGLKNVSMRMLRMLNQYMPSEGYQLTWNDPESKKEMSEVLRRQDLKYLDHFEIDVPQNLVKAVRGLEQQIAAQLYERLMLDQSGVIDKIALTKWFVDTYDPRIAEKIIRSDTELQKIQELLVLLDQKEKALAMREKQLAAKVGFADGVRDAMAKAQAAKNGGITPENPMAAGAGAQTPQGAPVQQGVAGEPPAPETTGGIAPVYE